MSGKSILTNKKIKDIMEETSLTRPTVMRFLAGDFDNLQIKNFVALCKATDTEFRSKISDETPDNVIVF